MVEITITQIACVVLQHGSKQYLLAAGRCSPWSAFSRRQPTAYLKKGWHSQQRPARAGRGFQT